MADRTVLRPSAAAGRQDRPPRSLWRDPRLRLPVLVLVALAVVAGFLLWELPSAWQYVLPLRVEKATTMVLVAAAVGVSTVLFQTVTGNRILTPGIMGFDALYVLIQTIAVFLFGIGSTYSQPGTGLLRWALEVAIMVLGVTLLYRWLFFGARRSLHLLVLVGIVFGTLFRAVSTFVMRMLDPAAFAVLQDDLFATFNTVDDTLLAASAVIIAAVGLVLIRMRRVFDVLALGQDISTGLGVDHRRVVMGVLVMIGILVSVSTALVGPITFFGLLVANLAYAIVGDRHARSLPAAVALGVIALIGGQFVLERVFDFATSLSIIIEFLGGIVFIVLVLSTRPRGGTR